MFATNTNELCLMTNEPGVIRLNDFQNIDTGTNILIKFDLSVFIKLLPEPFERGTCWPISVYSFMNSMTISTSLAKCLKQDKKQVFKVNFGDSFWFFMNENNKAAPMLE